MSSGLPINTFSQAEEYRKRYLATLALIAQNDAYNLQANQVYKQTGQPSRPADTRSTTEKLGDIEAMKVALRRGLMGITDGTQANETVENLTVDEVIFTTQQLPAIISDLKPRFANGVPAQALLAYIRALRRKFLATNGVSFTAQEATSQQILNAIQAGVTALNAPAGPFGMGGSGQGGLGPIPLGPVEMGPTVSPPTMSEEDMMRLEQQAEQEAAATAAQGRRITQARQIAENWLRSGTEPFTSLPKNIQDLINEIRQTKGQSGSGGEALMVAQFKQIYKDPARQFGPNSMEEWRDYPEEGGFAPFPDATSIQMEFLKMWARTQSPEIQAKFNPTWSRKRTVASLKAALIPGVIAKLSSRGSAPGFFRQETDISGLTTLETPMQTPTYEPSESEIFGTTSTVGKGFSRTRHAVISGYGLSLPKKVKNSIQVDMSKGLAYESAPSYIAFGKYVINPNKMSSGVFDMKTMKGGAVAKYPTKMVSAKLSKMINRIIGGRMPDEEDFNEMDLNDQNFLYNLANDAKIMDRLKLPTPKRTKEGEEINKFEILKGQISAGNDNKELVKEFKQMLVKLSDQGRIKKSEAREILLDLVALGH